MSFDLLKSAMAYRRNIIALIASVLIGVVVRENLAMFPFPFPFPAQILTFQLPLAVYVGFILQSMVDKTFRREYEKQEMIRRIKRVSSECNTQSRNLRRKLKLQDQQRLSKVISEMNEVVRVFLSGDKSYIKVQVVEKAMKLTDIYIKLMDYYYTRIKASDREQISFLARRINTNSSNLSSVRDPATAEELRKVIEADERMINSLKEGRNDLEKVDARLQYMESTISMLKYNITSNLETDSILQTLENEINEAAAINTVLSDMGDEHRRQRIRL